MTHPYETEAQFQAAVMDAAERQFPITTLNYGIMAGMKYESRSAALTAPGMAHERWRFTMHHKSTPNDNSIPHGYCHCGCGEKTGIAKKTVRRDGWVKGEPKRFINHHRPSSPSPFEWDTSLGCYRIELSRGQYALVDSQDIDKVSSIRWSATKFGYGWYALRNTDVGATSLMHRVIMDAPSDMVVDHINGDGLDNRRSNLRLCTKGENNRNRIVMQSTNTSGYRGVSWQTERQKYVAQIKVDRKARNLGRFLCPIEAAITRDIAAIALHGDYAVLNFPHLRELFEGAV